MAERVADFAVVEQALNRASAAVGAAEAHGMLLGMACVRGSVGPDTWIAQVLPEADPADMLVQEGARLLGALYEQALAGLYDEDLNIVLLLPADDVPLAERLAALGRWCEGFLYGLGAAGLREDHPLEVDAAEFLRDLAEIARVDLDAGDDGEDAERAFAEIVEYVRMGVLLLNGALHPPSTRAGIQ